MTNYDVLIKSIRGLVIPKEPIEVGAGLAALVTGGYLDIHDATYEVVAVSKYLDVKWDNFKKRKKDYWVTELELFHLLSGEKTFVEWEIDDDVEFALTQGLNRAVERGTLLHVKV